jgi:hypothetical protein
MHRAAAQFERFNYHLGRQDWADGRMPRFNAAVIKSMLGEWFGAVSPDGRLGLSDCSTETIAILVA